MPTPVSQVADFPENVAALLPADAPVWTTDEMRAEFAVEGFAAPFVVVRRKADDALGSLQFTHQPRYYFAFVEDQS